MIRNQTKYNERSCAIWDLLVKQVLQSSVPFYIKTIMAFYANYLKTKETINIEHLVARTFLSRPKLYEGCHQNSTQRLLLTSCPVKTLKVNSGHKAEWLRVRL